MKKTNKKNYPKILIISNNALSLTKNNGKTLESFFKNYPSEKLAQLYFSDETPESEVCNNFFNISDKMLLKRLFNKNYLVNDTNRRVNNNAKKKSPTERIIRELLWNKKLWLNYELDEWLSSYQPEIVFFMAGDSGFAYNIVNYIVRKFNCRLVTYITDDYILPSFNFSLSFHFRRLYIKNKMKKCVKMSSLFFTVSEPMRAMYRKLFGKDSIVIRNMTKHLYQPSNDIFSNGIKIVYAGGLNYGRDKVLIAISNAINDFNITNNCHVTFEIYSNTSPTKKFISKILNDKFTNFCGSVGSEKLNCILNTATILVFVEDFSKKNISYTKLSFSTKITDYIAMKKCILSVGPLNSASINYLSNFSYSINYSKKIKDDIYRLLSDKTIIEFYANKTAEKYKEIEQEYDADKIVINNVLSMYEGGRL